MKKTKFLKYIYTSIISILLVLLISACSTNKRIPTPIPESNPNEASIFFFLTGNLLVLNDEFSEADTIFRMAWKYDPNSPNIMQSLFNTNLYLFKHDKISINQLEGLVDTLKTMHAMNKTMQEDLFITYIITGHYLKAKRLVQKYIKEQPTANAYVSLFYIKYYLEEKYDFSLLDKAIKLGFDNEEILNSLSYFYLTFEPSKAEPFLLYFFNKKRTVIAAKYLWSLYAQKNDNKKLKKFWNTFSYPQDKEMLNEILKYAYLSNNLDSIVMLSEDICITQDKDLLFTLFKASWYTKANKEFEKAYTLLQSFPLSKQEKQMINFYSSLYFLRVDQAEKALQYISKLDGINILIDFLYHYGLDSIPHEKQDDMNAVVDAYKKLNNVLSQAGTLLPSPVIDYFIHAMFSLLTNRYIEVSDKVTYECVRWFYDNNRRTYDSYLFLLRYYENNGSKEQRIELLKEALIDYPDDADFLNNLGYNYVLENTNLEEAEVMIKRAIQISPDNPLYWDSLAWLHYQKGLFDLALKDMQIPIEMDGMPGEIAMHLAYIYYKLSDWENARKYAQKTLEINDNDTVVQQAQKLLDEMNKSGL